jgi:two-component system sensor histidine kinase AlgZ
MNAAAPRTSGRGDDQEFFLPDFCAARAVLAIVLIAALLGFVLALGRRGGGDGFWIDLARMSAFLLWAGLLTAAALCRARPWLARKTLRSAVAWTLAMMAGVALVLSEVVYWLGRAWLERLGASSDLFPQLHMGFVLPNVLIAVVVGALMLRYFYVAQQWRQSVELEARSRIRALQARIRPHFLFNSLNTIASLTRSDAVQAEAAIEDLADLFRVSLSDSRAQIALREEIDVARTYQRIEQLRLGERLEVQWDIAGLPSEALVPSLLLQPLLENAIGHGIERLPGGGTVQVRGRVADDSIVLEVRNPAPIASAAAAPRRGHGIALDNIRQRLELAFPGRSAVEVDAGAGQYCVRLRFPLLRETTGATVAAQPVADTPAP